jgi:hypothetical protein
VQSGRVMTEPIFTLERISKMSTQKPELETTALQTTPEDQGRRKFLNKAAYTGLAGAGL